MTIPMIGVEGGVPLVTEVYLEFEDQDGAVLELHEVEEGETYELIVSQKGGLVRYRMGDRVLVKGLCGRTPTFSFVGRGSSPLGVDDEYLPNSWCHIGTLR